VPARFALARRPRIGRAFPASRLRLPFRSFSASTLVGLQTITMYRTAAQLEQCLRPVAEYGQLGSHAMLLSRDSRGTRRR
jgi:hypothetical protein